MLVSAKTIACTGTLFKAPNFTGNHMQVEPTANLPNARPITQLKINQLTETPHELDNDSPPTEDNGNIRQGHDTLAHKTTREQVSDNETLTTTQTPMTTQEQVSDNETLTTTQTPMGSTSQIGAAATTQTRTESPRAINLQHTT
ncbi:MAG TPA: hypothetical protein V6C97_33290 [Oculatellaceae cyanobacterium]